MRIDLVNKFIDFQKKRREEKEELESRQARLRRLRKIKAQVDDEEDLYEELEEIGREREIKEEEFEEKEKDFKQIAEDPEDHEWEYENNEAYRRWWNTRQGEESVLEVEEETPRIPSQQETPSAMEREVGVEEEIDSSIVKHTSEATGLDEEIVFEALEGEEETLNENELEELAKQRKIDPADLVTFNREYKEYKRSRSRVSKQLALSAADGKEEDAEELIRVFWGYVPATLIREKYHLGVTKANKANLSLRLKDWKNQIEKYNEQADVLQEGAKRFTQEDAKRIRDTIATLDERKDILEDVADLVIEASRRSDEDSQDPEFQEAIKPSLRRVQRIDQDLTKLRRSFPTNADYGVELDGLAAPLSYVSTDLSEFLINPGKKDYTIASSFLDWHTGYGKGDQKFDQLYKMIFDYAYLECARRMRWDPSVLNAPGVEGDANSLLNAVLYGIGLQHAETKNESELASLGYTEYVDPKWERFVYDKEAFEEELASIENPLEKGRLKKAVESYRRHKLSINERVAVFSKIHEHLNPTKHNMVCPECSASWWSFQAGQFQTNAFPNSSGEIFNNSVLPKAKGLSPDKYEELKGVSSSIFNEWRFNPFRAPIGIIARGEGEFCGGVYEGADVTEVVAKIEYCAKEAQEEKKETQALLDKLVEKAQNSSDENVSFPEELFEGPFDAQAIQRRHKIVFDGTKVARILLPDVSPQEATTNEQNMKEALYEGKSVESFSYFERELIVTKEQLAKLKEELKGKLCFEPKRGQAMSLADLISKSVSNAIRVLKRYLPKYSKQLGVSWTCPACQQKNTEPVSQEVLEHSDRMFKAYQVMCSNELCSDRIYNLSEVSPHKTPIAYSPPSKSLEYSSEEGGSTISSTIEGPKELQPTYQIEEEEKEQEKIESIKQLVEQMNKESVKHAFEIKPSNRSRKKKEISFNNLGDAALKILETSDKPGQGVTNNEDIYARILKAKSPELLLVAQELGLILPFTVCKSCGTIHPEPARPGQTRRCIYVENTKLVRQMTMNEIAREFKRIERDVPDYPSVHIPDFEYWKEQWDKNFTSTANVKFTPRFAQLDDDEFDFSKLGDEEEDFSSLIEEGKEEEEEDIFEVLKGLGTQVTETPEELDEIGMDLLLDAEIEVEDDDDEKAKQIEEDEEPIEEIKTPGTKKGPSGIDLLDEAVSLQEQLVKKPEDAFELQTLEETLTVLPPSTRKEILGTDMHTYNSGVQIEDIPDEVLRALKKKLGISEIKEIVDNPIGIVRDVFDEFMGIVRAKVAK